MTERTPEELMFDPTTRDKFIGIRVCRGNGQRVGELIAVSESAEEAFAALRRDQLSNPLGEYFFYRPVDPKAPDERRQGWMISQDREDLV